MTGQERAIIFLLLTTFFGTVSGLIVGLLLGGL